MKAIILISEASLPLAKTLQRELPDTLIYTKNECEGCISITSCHRFIEEHFNDFDSIIFIGAMGICVRSIAGCIKNKYKESGSGLCGQYGALCHFSTFRACGGSQ